MIFFRFFCFVFTYAHSKKRNSLNNLRANLLRPRVICCISMKGSYILYQIAKKLCSFCSVIQFTQPNRLQEVFVSLHKIHFSKFGFSCHIQRHKFWTILIKENIETLIINEVSVKYRDFLNYILKGKPSGIQILCVFTSRNNFRWTQAVLNKYHLKQVEINKKHFFFINKKIKNSIFKMGLYLK